jgi:hypothetical protein
MFIIMMVGKLPQHDAAQASSHRFVERFMMRKLNIKIHFELSRKFEFLKTKSGLTSRNTGAHSFLSVSAPS